MGFIWSIIIGMVAGFLAGNIFKGKGSGMLINLIVGVIGGVLGGWMFGLLGLSFDGTIGRLATSTVGAIVLLWILSFFKGKKGSGE